MQPMVKDQREKLARLIYNVVPGSILQQKAYCRCSFLHYTGNAKVQYMFNH